MDLLHSTQNSCNKIKPSAAAEVGPAILEFNKTEILHSKAITDNVQNTGFQHHALSGNHNIFTWLSCRARSSISGIFPEQSLILACQN
jgi:hypothetical protein